MFCPRLIVFVVCLVFAGCVCGCGLQQPRTEIGMFGYVNTGYEKSLDYQGPLALVLADGTRLETPDGHLSIVNDATKTYQAQLEYQAANQRFVSDLVGQLVPLINTWMTQAYAPPATQPAAPAGDSRIDKILDALDRIADRIPADVQ
jgi:hypothetical protein